MIEKIKMNPVVFKSYSSASNVVTNPIDNKPREFNPDFYIDKNGAEAIKAANFVANPLDINKPISMKDYKNKLINAGLVENKDFDVISSPEYGGGAIFITRGYDKPIKTVFWDDGLGAENYSGYEDIFYPKNQGDIAEVRYIYDEKNILNEKTMVYANPDAHKDLFPENIDINTTPEDYIKVLKQNGIKYDVSTEKDDATKEIRTIVNEYSNSENPSKITRFWESSERKDIMQDNSPNNNGDLLHSVSLFKSKNSDYYELWVEDYVKDKGLKNTMKY